MNSNTSNTALILFTRSAKEEARAKRFSYQVGKKGNELIASKLISHATKLAERAGVDFFVFTEKEQVEGNFGQRLANAYQEVFEQGYDHVISIGNDSPSLDTDTISKAIKDLQRHDFVIGPALDGGVYLLGINRAYFDIDVFSNLLWKTDRLLKDIMIKLPDAARAKLLHPLADIDHSDDFNTFLLTNFTGLAGRLKSLLISFQSQWYGHHINTYVGRLVEQGSSRRGPPTHL